MKKNKIILSFAFVAMSIMAYGFVNWSGEEEQGTCAAHATCQPAEATADNEEIQCQPAACQSATPTCQTEAE
ncbi:MAG: hypothetical protein P8H59_09435 [Flavobacteriales bacterium]|nr:hypothetical protein [Flavobacteriales bacterium]MDG1781162.1 hypothetical protein [Flavobacteriales bacterium]MDG2245997.1 hypothetical protein [Flavobacteriales bacterium]